MTNMKNCEPEMELPKGKTCSDCIHWKPTCEWLISSMTGKETNCSWNPSRFVEIRGKQN